jgi:hypothetical protein
VERIKIDGKYFGFHIFPFYSKIYAEIYWIRDSVPSTMHDCEIFVLSKTFGKFWQKQPIEKDYVDARAWALEQLKNIEEANK